MRRNLTRAFSSDEYEHQRRDVFEKGQKQAQPIMDEAQKAAETAGFSLRFSPTGISLLPMADGKEMAPEEFGALTADERKEIEARQRALSRHRQ